MAQEDICVVCADPLDWTGFGPCGHKEACSRCVARMRFVLGDKKCVMCREEAPQAFFTRFSGDYTARLPPDQFPELQVGDRVTGGVGRERMAGCAVGSLAPCGRLGAPPQSTGWWHAQITTGSSEAGRRV